MLMPEYAASRLMYVATMAPASRPVQRARRGALDRQDPNAICNKKWGGAGSGRAWWTGEVGYSRSTTKTQAESMYSPNAAPSITYSGQWRRRALSKGWPPTEASGGNRTNFRGR